MRTVAPAELMTESTRAGTVARVVTAWPSEFVVVMSVTTESVSRAVVKTERVKVLPPEVIVVGTWAMMSSPLEEGTATGLVDPGAMYSVDNAAAEDGALGEGALLKAEEAAAVPGPVTPDGLADGTSLAKVGDEPPGLEDGATLPGALSEGAELPAAEDTAGEGELFVTGS